MAYKIGTATDYRDLLDQLVDFLQSKGTLAAPVYTGTGNGVLSLLDTQSQAPTETWTLECSNATKVGAADYGADIASETPLLHWRFNETTGTTAEDATANNRDGTISGTVTLGAAGLLSVDTDKAFTFGGGKVASSAIAAVQLTGDAAIECVINPSAVSGTRFLMGVGAAGTGNANNYLISLWAVDGYLKIYHEYGAGNIQQVTTDVLIANGRKDHIVLSRDNATKTYELIIGGIVRHTFQYLFSASDGTNAAFLVGADADGGNAFAGVIDEAAIYGAKMSAATAKSHAEAALGHETFTVTGSVSGVEANAIVGVPYKNDFIGFLISDGSTDFIVGDDWSIGVTAGDLGAQAWAVNRREQDKVFLQGPGLSGTDEIYVSIKTYFDAGLDYYNWEIRGADGYDATVDETGQPNVSAAHYMPAWNTSIAYWFRASGRFFIVVAKISTTYHGCYGGLMLAFATPTQYPYPLVVAGSSGVKTNRWSVSNETVRMFFSPCVDGFSLRDPDGAWRKFSHAEFASSSGGENILHPYWSRSLIGGRATWTLIRESLGGKRCLWAITLRILGTQNPNYKGTIGVLDGCKAVSGFDTATEDIVDGDGIDHVVFQNVFRTATPEYFALELN
jgi:hypothetical protein